MKKYDWVISKGIFTEMFAATGTAFQKKVVNNRIVTDQNPLLGNYSYNVLDEKAKKAYNALKRWHTAHMAFYDKAIDPLTSPKALNKSEMNNFYQEYLKIRHVDLNIMGDVLDLIYHDADSVMNFIETSIIKYQPFFQDQERKIDKLYRQSNLIYNANVNPFIKVR